MTYVRSHGNQLALVHGGRDAEGKVQQQVLATICSRTEAEAVLDPDQGRQFEWMLQVRNPHLRFDWERIRASVRERQAELPETYAYREDALIGRFRKDLCALVRQLGLTDPQTTSSAAELIREQRVELEYLRNQIDWRLSQCDREATEWNSDNAFYWRQRFQDRGVPPEAMETIAEHWARRELDKVEVLARLFLDTYEDYAEGHNYLGLVALDRERPGEAIAHFERAMEVGRRLFPRRIPKSSWWRDDATRPYIRGMRNLALALLRARDHERALEVCDRLEREVHDADAATTFRASVFLNTGRWEEARAAAVHLVGIWPEHAYIAAFASFELGERDAAREWFLHGLLNKPRTGRMLLGIRGGPAPTTSSEVDDHNMGIEELRQHEPFLTSLSAASRRFFRGVLASDVTAELLGEAKEVARRWNAERGGDRTAFDRMRQMESLSFAKAAAARIGADGTR